MDPLRIAIVGTGSRGVRCYGALLGEKDDVSITALCDPNPVRLRLAKESLELDASCYTDHEDMFAKEELDAAVIASPDYCHEANAVSALSHGVSVLIDKPLSTTVKGCRNIIAAAEKSGKTAMVGFNMRHDPVLKRLKELVDDGLLGRIFLIESREFYDGGRTYMARWNRSYENSGGLWVHKGCHDFDFFNWLLDFPRPVKVCAFAGVNVLTPEGIPFEVKDGTEVGPTCHECMYRETCPDVRAFDGPEFTGEAREADGYAKDVCIYLSDKDVHDNGIAIVEYENGVRASHMECFITPISDRRYTVIGDKGQAEVSTHDRHILVRPRWSREIIEYRIPKAEGTHGGSDPILVDDFVRVLQGVVQNLSTVEQGQYSTAIGQAAEIARREERVVNLKELLG